MDLIRQQAHSDSLKLIFSYLSDANDVYETFLFLQYKISKFNWRLRKTLFSEAM